MNIHSGSASINSVKETIYSFTHTVMTDVPTYKNKIMWIASPMIEA